MIPRRRDVHRYECKDGSVFLVRRVAEDRVMVSVQPFDRPPVAMRVPLAELHAALQAALGRHEGEGGT